MLWNNILDQTSLVSMSLRLVHLNTEQGGVVLLLMTRTDSANMAFEATRQFVNLNVNSPVCTKQVPPRQSGTESRHHN